jgi:periplasmic protein TonB
MMLSLSIPRKAGMRTDAIGISLLFSVAIHVLAILLGSVVIHSSNFRRQDFVSIGLIDLPPTETTPTEKPETPAKLKKPLSPAPELEKLGETKPIAKHEILKPEQPAPPAATPVKEEPPKTIETRPNVTAKPEIAATPTAPAEGGGSEAGAGNFFGSGDVAVVPGSETAGGGGGTAAWGPGRGSGSPGLTAPTAPLRTNREAKPLQTVRASYPPMALRMGLESDVTLKIEVDSEGKVTAAEIIRPGGTGFDEEALKAVKQSRFEPAQKDGKNVPAEFTYIYRFRLQR